MTLSAAVMAHPKRAEMVAELRTQLDRDVPVVWDQLNDRHDTGARAMEAFDPACTHHLVIQDDTVPAADLLAGAERALEFTPGDVPVSLYLGRVRPFGRYVQKAVDSSDGASWITMSGIYWGPAVILPTVDIPEMLEWFRSVSVKNYDRRMSRWYEARKKRCWYSWPSLVDHRGTVSLAHGVKGPAERRAHRFVEGSALGVDWSGDVVNMNNTGRLDRKRQALAR